MFHLNVEAVRLNLSSISQLEILAGDRISTSFESDLISTSFYRQSLLELKELVRIETIRKRRT